MASVVENEVLNNDTDLVTKLSQKESQDNHDNKETKVDDIQLTIDSKQKTKLDKLIGICL